VVRFSVLGPVRVERDGEVVDLGSPRQRAVLSLLILDANLTATVDRLVEDLWQDEPPADPGGALRVYVSNLRRALEPGHAPRARTHLIRTQHGGYSLAVSPEALDAHRFRTLAESGRRALAEGSVRAARQQLTEALGEWRGPPFADLHHVDRLAEEATRLTDLHLDTLERRLAADLALGRPDAVIQEAEALVSDHPYREDLWHHLIVALYRTGRQADALAAYERLRTQLVEELGIEPTPELRHLHRAVLTQDPSLTQGSVEPEPGNIPRPSSSFVGRAREVRELTGLVDRARLVTLVGAGGSGKTRLANELAAQVAEDFAHGCWWVDLARAERSSELAADAAEAVGIRVDGDATPALVRWFRTRRGLLVLDNCEHLVGPCGQLVGRLLAEAPGLHVIATSREPLGAPGEVTYEVPPLGLPDPAATPAAGDALGSDAVRLLVERGREAVPGFEVTDGNAAAVVEIARRLDGLPLAIELAARRLRALSPEEMVVRLSDRLHLLVGGARSALPRHRTLRATLEWSYELLSEDEARLLRRVWVFAAPFDIRMAEAVCADEDLPGARVLDLLAGLVDRSMLVVGRGPTTRYRLLETVREFAHELALEEEDVEGLRRRHRDAVLALVEGEVDHLKGPGLPAALARFGEVHDDVRRAIGWSLDRPGELEAALRLGAASVRFWLKRGHLREGRDLLERIARAASDRPSTRYVEVLVGLGHVDHYQPDVARAEHAVTIAEALGDPGSVAWARLTLALVLVRSGRFEEAAAAARAARPAAQRSEDLEAIGTAAAYEAIATKRLGQLLRAQELFEDAAAVYRRLGDPWDAAWAIANLADIAQELGDDARAIALIEPEIAVFHRIGDLRAGSDCLEILARACLRRGDADAAAGHLVAALRLDLRSGDEVRAGYRLVPLAELASERGDAERAATLLGAADATGALARPRDDRDRDRLERLSTVLVERLGRQAYDRLRAEGRALSATDALAHTATPVGRGSEA
jgi:predicted ATPase/DNA-binding SARP family transcriptional activator